MTEACTVRLRDIPSWRLRRRVRKFVKGEQVVVRDTAGVLYSVELKRDQLILQPEEEHCIITQGAKGISKQCS